ncbi:MAG: hypothetical protein D6698_12710 [Gammaproteobacteria bacterium]|nr:MAG: hypothetical protein D6698_12710 [Gammaproteobacteria bacterium]
MEKYITPAFGEGVHDVQSFHHYIQQRQQTTLNALAVINHNLTTIVSRMKQNNIIDEPISQAVLEISEMVERLAGGVTMHKDGDR